MNDVFVAVDPADMTMRRYSAAGGLRLTHEAVADQAGDFCPEVVEMFRIKPPERMRVQPVAPWPWSPPSGGGTPAAVAA